MTLLSPQNWPIRWSLVDYGDFRVCWEPLMGAWVVGQAWVVPMSFSVARRDLGTLAMCATAMVGGQEHYCPRNDLIVGSPHCHCPGVHDPAGRAILVAQEVAEAAGVFDRCPAREQQLHSDLAWAQSRVLLARLQDRLDSI
jgi:hypothetical protein